MSRFDEAVKVVLEHEGWDQYSDHPADPGGATKWGISLAFLRKLGKIGDIDGDGDVDADDVRRLPKDKAIEIYRTHWWEPLRLDEMKHSAMAVKVFDLAVNMGSTVAVRLFQQALRTLREPISADGILGSQTLAAANHADPIVVLELYRLNAARYYYFLVDQNPDLVVFERGWIRRALA